MERADRDVPAEAPDTAPGETFEGSPAERTGEASRYADRKAREEEVAEAPPDDR
jgi:hypothetical protein